MSKDFPSTFIELTNFPKQYKGLSNEDLFLEQDFICEEIEQVKDFLTIHSNKLSEKSIRKLYKAYFELKDYLNRIPTL